MSESLERLEELVQVAQDLADLVTRRGHGSVTWRTRDGECRAQVLLYCPDEAGVVRAELDAGDVFLRHGHPEAEHLIVCSGTIAVSTDGQPVEIVTAPMAAFLAPGVAHSVQAVEQARLIGVTIPASEGYADERQGNR